ncbi:MAG: ribosomal protein S18 acetylase RimI-like enzyme [Akkermansiaceae bacterium]
MLGEAEVSLRPETPEDFSFLEELVFAVREGEAGFRELLLSERIALLKEQTRLQVHHYRKVYPNAHFMLIEAEGKPVGRYYVHQALDHLLIVELSILPAFQGHGIGRQLIKSAQAEAIRTKVPVRLSVEMENPAMLFYEGLGFVRTKTEASHQAMVWMPPGEFEVPDT